MAKANDHGSDMFDDMDFEPVIEADEDVSGGGGEVDFENDEQSLSPAPVRNALPAEKPKAPLDFDFGGLEDLPGVVVGDLGIELSRLPVERAKFTKDSRSLISIVSGKVVAVKTHYREGLGSYLCFGGKCCEADGLARVKYLFPVVVYDTDKRGAPVSSDVSYKVLAIGKDQYDDIRTMAELNGDITGYDILVSCKDEQYQKLSFSLAGDARWRKSRRLTQATREFWKTNMKNLIMPVARRISERDLMKETAGDEINSNGDINFDDVFND